MAQVLAGGIWLGIAVWLAPSFFRLIRGRGGTGDHVRSCFLFMGLVQFGFTLRWRLYPSSTASMSGEELQLWVGLYALSTLLAVWVVMVARAYGRGGAE